MHPIDLVILIIVGGLGVLGFWRGFVRELIETVGAIVAALISYRYYPSVASAVGVNTDSGWLAKIGAFLILFIVLMILISIFGRLVRRFVRKINLGMYDRLLGFVLGALKGGIAVAVVASAIMWVGPAGEDLVAQSKLAKADLLAFDLLSGALPDNLRQKQQSLLGGGKKLVADQGLSFPFYSIKQVLTDAAAIGKLIPDEGLQETIMALAGRSEEAENLHGEVVSWDPSSSRGMVSCRFGDATQTFPLYYGSFADDPEVINLLQEGSEVSFDVVYSSFSNELCAMNVALE